MEKVYSDVIRAWANFGRGHGDMLQKLSARPCSVVQHRLFEKWQDWAVTFDTGCSTDIILGPQFLPSFHYNMVAMTSRQYLRL